LLTCSQALPAKKRGRNAEESEEDTPEDDEESSPVSPTPIKKSKPPSIGDRVVAGHYFEAGRAFVCVKSGGDLESAFLSEGDSSSDSKRPSGLASVSSFGEWSRVISKMACHAAKVSPAVAEDLLEYQELLARLDASYEWPALAKLDAEWRRKISRLHGSPFKYASIDPTLVSMHANSTAEKGFRTPSGPSGKGRSGIRDKRKGPPRLRRFAVSVANRGIRGTPATPAPNRPASASTNRAARKRTANAPMPAGLAAPQCTRPLPALPRECRLAMYSRMCA